MQQSDYILREIEKISIIILGLLGKLTRTNKEGKQIKENALNEAAMEFETNANVDIGTVLRTSSVGFDQLFTSINGFDERNTELVADLLVAMGEIALPESKKQFFVKAMEVYIYLDHSGKTYSIDRATKIRQLQTFLRSVD